MEGPICVKDFEAFASQHLSKNSFSYFSSGADEEDTLKENCKAYKRLKFRPTLLRGHLEVDLKTRILDNEINFPICIAPTATQKMAHPDGESATARAASHFGTCMVLSTFANTSIEEVAASSPTGIRWMQLYIFKDRAITLNLVKRAEAEGYQAIALTVDSPTLGYRRHEYHSSFTFPGDLTLANFDENSGKLADECMDIPGYSGNAALAFEPDLSWNSVRWLQSVTKLPLILKGILTGEDALKAVEVGAHGIMVSNHGGRQLDGVQSTIEALPEVVKAVNGRCEVYMDGGIRTGNDVVKALALGAKAVFIGRPVIWALAYDGENGVKKLLSILKQELERCMMLLGCGSLQDIRSTHVVHDSFSSRL